MNLREIRELTLEHAAVERCRKEEYPKRRADVDVAQAVLRILAAAWIEDLVNPVPNAILEQALFAAEGGRCGAIFRCCEIVAMKSRLEMRRERLARPCFATRLLIAMMAPTLLYSPVVMARLARERSCT
jgi:hypothetical protein